MGFLKMIRNIGTLEGTREACRMSYRKHVKLAAEQGETDPGARHAVGLYGLLATRYRTRGLLPPEVAVWAELVPFLLMEPGIAVEALAEYVVAQEHSPSEVRKDWLQRLISDALRRPPSSVDSPRHAAAIAVTKP
jgi:hypothetical protein